MEYLKELLTPTSFNKLSYVAVIFWIVIGGILFGVFADTEYTESRFDFSCGVKRNKDLIEGKCFEKYGKRYNKLSIPVYGFVIVNFSLIALVAVIYSHIVKSRVNDLDSHDADNESQPQQAHPTSRRLFVAYCCQLAFRVSLGILFMVLQTQVLYPNNFPSDFKCDVMNNSVTPSTNFTQVTQAYQCHNQRATKKTFWTNAVIVVNGAFAFFAFIEFVWILSRAGKKEKYMEDSKFFADHLKGKPQTDRQQTPQTDPQQTPQTDPQQTPQTDPQQIPLPSLAEKLQAFIQTMKNRVKEGTEQPRDLKQPIYRPNPGEDPHPKDLKIDQIYTNLKIQEGRAKYNFPTDRREQLKVYPEPNPKKPEFVRPEHITDAQHKNVLVVGRPGIGKTLFCAKRIRDWASDKLGREFDVAFLLKFRRFSGLTEPIINLRELLCASEYTTNLDDEVWNHICENPSKVCLLFDGIDELATNSKISKYYRNTTEEEKMPLHALYNKIASGELLKGATLITTTRPTAVSWVKHLNFNRTVEILGFRSEQVEEYVEKFTKGDLGAERSKETIWRHISTNLNLFSLSYIPVNCFIICSCLYYVLRTCGSSCLPTKLTEIYSIAIKIFFFRHGETYRYSETDCDQFVFKQFRELPSTVQEVFKRLGAIAFKGIKERRLIFGTREVEGLEDCGLLHRLPDRPAPGPLKPREAQYCFMHLTIQEFLAAKHLVDTKDDEQLRTFVCDNKDNGVWQIVTQFVAGLLKERKNPPTGIFTNLLPVSTDEGDDILMTGILDVFKRRKLTRWPAEKDKHLALNACKCLNEIDENDSLVQDKLAKINCNAVDFSKCSLTPVDCAAVLHVIRNAKGILCMNLQLNYIGPLGCVEILKFFKSDRNKDNKLTHLNLASNNITDEGLTHLTKALMHHECKLTHLNLWDNHITDEGLTHLTKALMHHECKLTHLNLMRNNITDEGLTHLTKALMHHECKLTHLNLMRNNITDEGLTHLTKALMHHECKLTHLNLWDNHITDEGLTHLTKALMHHECKLTHLNLTNNNITDEGLTHLTKALMHHECKLTHLNLGYNKITDEGLTHLTKALMHHECKLTDLNLASNNITDEGLTHLTKALMHHECKLTALNLMNNNITAEGLTHLTKALMHHECKLTHLNLQANNITHEGLTHLTKALMHHECKLTDLNLMNNNITAEGLTHLTKALMHHECKLTHLNLQANNITAEGLTHLTKALMHHECKLTYLNLSENNITDEGLTHLTKALMHHECKLTYLNLMNNNITDEGLKHLTKALMHHECKLTHLALASNNITAEGLTHLTKALMHHECKLTYLNLWDNNITAEEDKKLLSEARSLKTHISF